MSSPVNVGWTLTGDDTAVEGDLVITIPVNRWSRCCYTFQTETGDDTSLYGTITELNRPDRLTGIAPTPVWSLLLDDSGAGITGAGAGEIFRLSGYALEAVQVRTAVGEAANGRFMQQGESD